MYTSQGRIQNTKEAYQGMIHTSVSIASRTVPVYHDSICSLRSRHLRQSLTLFEQMRTRREQHEEQSAITERHGARLISSSKRMATIQVACYSSNLPEKAHMRWKHSLFPALHGSCLTNCRSLLVSWTYRQKYTGGHLAKSRKGARTRMLRQQ